MISPEDPPIEDVLLTNQVTEGFRAPWDSGGAYAIRAGGVAQGFRGG